MADSVQGLGWPIRSQSGGGRARRLGSGLTLLELLVAAVIFAMVATTLTRAFWFALRYEMHAPDARLRFEQQIAFEDRLRSLLQQAYISSSASDLSTYMIGTEGGQNPNGSPNLTAAMAAPGTAAATATNPATTTGASVGTGGNSDGIVFTAVGQQLPPNYLEATGVELSDQSGVATQIGGAQNFQQQQNLPNGQSAESDLGQLNSDYGPQGGVTEISISQTPVGDPGQYTGALYIRTQRPADADYTQGGTEQVFDDNIQKLQFEFYDGQNWDGGWDTTQSGMHYLPAAVRVHYWLKTDPNTEHIFVVRMPLSTLTPQSPLGSAPTGTSTSTGGTATSPGGTRTGTGTGAAAPLSLSGFLPLYTNLKIEPDGEGMPGNAIPEPGALKTPQATPAQSAPDWRTPPGPFAYEPPSEPLDAPLSPALPRGWNPQRATTLSSKVPAQPDARNPLPVTRPSSSFPITPAAHRLSEDKGLVGEVNASPAHSHPLPMQASQLPPTRNPLPVTRYPFPSALKESK